VAGERAAVDEDVEAGIFSFDDDVHRCGHWVSSVMRRARGANGKC
jgi:hypothetical protein